MSERIYIEPRKSSCGAISSFAAAKSPLAVNLSITAKIFCIKIAGTELTIAEKMIHMIIIGSSTG